MQASKVIAFPHPPAPNGGPGSFQLRFIKSLQKQGWTILYPDDATDHSGIDVIFVVAGTRKLLWLFKNKMRGAVIIQRLAGVEWQYRIVKNNGIWGRIKPGIQNFLVRIIRDYLADLVVYQSNFTKDWWHQYARKTHENETIIYNAVDTDDYCSRDAVCSKLPKLLCVEGAIQNNEAYLQPIESLYKELMGQKLISEFVLVGELDTENVTRLKRSCPNIEIKGRISRDEVRKLYPGSVFFALEVNGACPNSVIEALASGAPVIGYDTGSLKELVPPEAGIVVEYGADPWSLDVPDLNKLNAAANLVLANFDVYSKGARSHALRNHEITNMSEKYIALIEKAINSSDRSEGQDANFL